jgi:hypothetical protein
MPCTTSGRLRPSKPCAARWSNALARSLPRERPPGLRAVRRASTNACHLAEVRSSAPAASRSYPGWRSRPMRIIRATHVSATAPRLSRPSPPAPPACSQASAVASSAASHACLTPRKADGDHPSGVSRRRRTKNALLVASPTPRVRPHVERGATTRRGNQPRPSSVSHRHDARWRPRRALAGCRRCTRRVAKLVLGASRRPLCVPFSQRQWKTRRLLARKVRSVRALQGG